MALIKDIYSAAFYNQFADTLQQVIPSFQKDHFMMRIFSDDFAHKEWKERMKHTTRIFHEFLPADFAEAVNMISTIIDRLKADDFGIDHLAFIFFADYIETYGLEDFEHSAAAFEFITQFISCEFAVRPFILKYGDKMIAQMISWSLHESPKVRRLASEGSRPRLPWAMAIPSLKINPEPILPLLENLKNDPSEYVRRSVANSINDIAKDHPDVVIALATRWRGGSKETDAIIKHGCRTLLKQGHPEVLKLYGLKSENISLQDFRVLTPEVKIGGSLDFSFSLINRNAADHMVRLEYGIYYKKSKGHQARKVFKISEKIYPPDVITAITRKQSFRLITTRVFYPGEHQVSIIINGEEKEKLPFMVSNK